MKKKQINCSVPADILERYQKLYPQTLTKLINNCLKKAINDKNFFYNLFFEVKND